MSKGERENFCAFFRRAASRDRSVGSAASSSAASVRWIRGVAIELSPHYAPVDGQRRLPRRSASALATTAWHTSSPLRLLWREERMDHPQRPRALYRPVACWVAGQPAEAAVEGRRAVALVRAFAVAGSADFPAPRSSFYVPDAIPMETQPSNKPVRADPAQQAIVEICLKQVISKIRILQGEFTGA